jgi:hypothetical protein
MTVAFSHDTQITSMQDRMLQLFSFPNPSFQHLSRFLFHFTLSSNLTPTDPQSFPPIPISDESPSLPLSVSLSLAHFLGILHFFKSVSDPSVIPDSNSSQIPPFLDTSHFHFHFQFHPRDRPSNRHCHIRPLQLFCDKCASRPTPA